jgi:hypothetical protein
MRTSISFNGEETLVAHLGRKQCVPQHVLVHSLKAIKFIFSDTKKKVRDRVLVVYLCLVSGRGEIDMPN